jgi:hypothetical protein
MENQETASAPATIALQPHYDLTHLHRSLVLVWDTLVKYPVVAEKHKNVGSVLDTLTALLYHRTPFVDFFASHLINSATFRYSICEYILNQRGDYNLGHDTLPPTADCPNGSQAKMNRDALFDCQKNNLFQVARALQTTRPSEVYDFARTCPDFFFVDEMKFYYGGAGRTCADIHMTCMAMSLDDAKQLAKDYLRKHTPPIDYREIFQSLDKNWFGQNRLITVDHDIKSIIPDPTVWMGAHTFNKLLLAADIPLDKFKAGFSDLSSANVWLRPFLRISNACSTPLESYNQLHFDPETGCTWRLREPHL